MVDNGTELNKTATATSAPATSSNSSYHVVHMQYLFYFANTGGSSVSLQSV